MSIDQQVQAALISYFEALHHKNWSAFSDCLTDDFTYFTDHGLTQNKTAFIAFLRKDAWQSIAYELSDVGFIAAQAEDMVIATYAMQFTGKIKQQQLSFKAVETTVLVKQEDGWKIRHTHTSNQLENN